MSPRTPASPEPEQPVTTGKGHATPTRKQAEAANKRPLVPADRKAASRAAKTERRAQRDREYAALQSGDERYLPPKDKGPQRRFVRDWIDARWTLGEFFLPVALILLVAQMAFTQIWAYGVAITLVLLYGYVLAMVLDYALRWRSLRRDLRARFGDEVPLRGLGSYTAIRMFQLRPTRLPKPMVARRPLFGRARPSA